MLTSCTVSAAVSPANQREKLGALQEKCARITEEIRSLQALLEETREEISQLQCSTQRIKDLPDDILQIVFEMAYRHYFPYCRAYWENSTDSPVILTHVCRRWRHLALSLSSLWSCLHIVSTEPEHSTPRGLSATALEVYLQRSGQRKLSVLISRHCSNEEDDSQEREDQFWEDCMPWLEDCLALLVQEAHRWQHCAIFITFPLAMEHIQRVLMQHSYPALEYFQLFAPAYRNTIHLDPDFSFDLDAPAVTHYRTHLVSPIQQLSFYTGMTELKLEDIGVSLYAPAPLPEKQLWAILEHAAPTLRRLTLYNISLSPINPSAVHARSATSFPCLQYLAFSWCNYRDNISPEQGDIFKLLMLNAPALTALICVQSSQPYAVFQTGLVSLPKLVRLVLIKEHRRHARTPIQMSYDGLFEKIIRACPAVRTAFLRGPGNLAIRCLQIIEERDASASEPGHIWPHVQWMTVSVSDEEDVRRAISFAAYRARIGCPVKSVALQDISESYNIEWEPKVHFCQLEEIGDCTGGTVRWHHGYDCYLSPYSQWGSWHEGTEQPSFLPWEGYLAFQDQFVSRIVSRDPGSTRVIPAYRT